MPRETTCASEAARDDRIARAWKQFVDGGEIDTTVIRPEIAESWRRSRAHGVDPFQWGFSSLLNAEQREERRKACEPLLLAAAPILEGLIDAISPFEMAILLTDLEGIVLRTIAKGPILKVIENANLKDGESLREEDAGTTSTAVVAHTGRAIQISGEEHYCKVSHGVTCAGAPIFSPGGRLIGILNITAPREAIQNHPYTLGMAVAAAGAIERNLRLIHESKEASLSHRFLAYAINYIPQGLILLDEDSKIRHVNREARRIMKLPDGVEGDLVEVLGRLHCLDESSIVRLRSVCLCDGAVAEEELVLGNREKRQSYLVSVTPVRSDDGSTLGRVIEFRQSRDYVRIVNRLSKAAEAHFTFADILGESATLRSAKNLAQGVAAGDSTVLLTGESGTGKEMFAHAIHLASPRRDGPFIAINCAAFPQELIESELFGYDEGAFTGARRGGRIGKIEFAEGGTLFLDEVGEMPLGLQVKLLRVLEERKIVRLGGNRSFSIDVRIIAASNRDLWQAARSGSFRTDLLYRLNVLNIYIPPLRERVADIPVLIDFFLESLQRRRDGNNGLSTKIREITREALDYLMRQLWPGNVRELRNWVEKALYIVDSPCVTLEQCRRISQGSMVGQTEASEPAPQEAMATYDAAGNAEVISMPFNGLSLRHVEREVILRALHSSGGNISRAAKSLGISRPTIYMKLKRYGLAHRSVMPSGV